MKKNLTFIFIFCWLSGKTQNGTFITLSSSGQLAKVTLDAGGCNSTNLNICNGTVGSPLSIALNGNILYVVDNKGYLYSTTLNSLGNCTNLGQFLSASTKTYGLTVDKYGKVYAANGTQIETYDATKPAGNEFAIIGNVPSGYNIGGDLLFYAEQLFMACGNNALLAIDTLNPTNSSTYLTFTSPNVFGFASVIVPCGNNQSYALSTQGSTTDIVGVDMQNKIETGIICSLNYKINDAASVAETQSATPTITESLSLDSCKQVTYLGKIYTTNIIVKDTLKSIAGCDSVYHNLIITIKQPTNDTLKKYTSTTPYIWNGNPYTKSGTYTKTGLTNSKGCDSTAILVLTINPIPCQTVIKKTNTITSCKPIVYKHLGKDSSFAVSTIVIDTLKNFGDCDSIYTTVSINISQKPKSIKIIIANCDSVVYKNIVYKTDEIFLDTIKTKLNGCDSVYKTTNITIYPKPQINASTAFYTYVNTPVLLSPTIINGYLYSWTPKLFLNDSTISAPFCTPQKDIIYKLKVTTKDGCKDSSYQTVIVAERIKIPSAFSPNGDNINDTWIIKGLQTYTHHKVVISNRFGQQIFTSLTGNYIPWNGTLNGSILPVGVYYYIINLSSNSSPITGSLVMLK